MSNSYSPTVVEGESPAEIWFERSVFNGEYLAAVAYGLHLAVFGTTAYFLARQTTNGKASWLFLVYIVLLLACGTINHAAGIRFAEMTWIDDRDIPGGPVAFMTAMYNNMIETLGNSAYITANFLADGLLLWRCLVVYGYNYWVMIIPTLAFMASTGLSIFTVIKAARPMASIWSRSAVVIAIPCWSISIALNIIVSLMIVVRLLWHRYTIGNTLGEKHTAMYTGLAAMFVESAALYGITGLVYLICYARNSYVQNLVLGVLSQTECMAPELILLRVALGRAWSAETSNARISTKIHFGTKTETLESPDAFGAASVSARNTRSVMSENHDAFVNGSETCLGASSEMSKSVPHVV